MDSLLIQTCVPRLKEGVCSVPGKGYAFPTGHRIGKAEPRNQTCPPSDPVAATPLSDSIIKTPLSDSIPKTPLSDSIAKTPLSDSISKTPLSFSITNLSP